MSTDSNAPAPPGAHQDYTGSHSSSDGSSAIPPAGRRIPCPTTGAREHLAYERDGETWCDTCGAERWAQSRDRSRGPSVASVASVATSRAPAWPVLNSKALHGLTGDFVRLLEPHTETDPVAILVQFLVYFGAIVGRNPHFRVEATRHGMNLYAVLVGSTSKARKGTSAQHVRRLFHAIDPEWVEQSTVRGLSSGEGLIHAVRDPIEKREPIKEDKRIIGYQTVEADQGVEDKRLLVIEEEFASPLKMMGREGNTLSPILRTAWDGQTLSILTRNSPARATDPHISIIGHVTAGELVRLLGATEAGNGFGNRFLWVLVRRSKCLPEGGTFHAEDQAPILRRLRQAVDHARRCDELRRDDAAREIWRNVYPSLSDGKPGLLGAMIARAEAQVMRLAALYALLDCAPEIRAEHLFAALAVWEYAEASARYIFGDTLGDPTADELLRLLLSRPAGVTRTEIRDHFGRHKQAAEIDRALGVLEEHGLACREPLSTGGRPAELWKATATKATEATKGPSSVA